MAPPTTLALEGPIAVFAQDNSGVLPRSFLLAVVLVAPLALWQWWRIRQRRQKSQTTGEPQASDQPELSSQPDTDQPAAALEALVSDIGRLGRDLGSEQTETLRIAQGITVAGRVTQRSLVDRLVADALARSGLEATESTDVNGDRLLECRRQ